MKKKFEVKMKEKDKSGRRGGKYIGERERLERWREGRKGKEDREGGRGGGKGGTISRGRCWF